MNLDAQTLKHPPRPHLSTPKRIFPGCHRLLEFTLFTQDFYVVSPGTSGNDGFFVFYTFIAVIFIRYAEAHWYAADGL